MNNINDAIQDEEIDCQTCEHYSDMEGNCKLGIADEWECSCCTGECKKYKKDKFYMDLEKV